MLETTITQHLNYDRVEAKSYLSHCPIDLTLSIFSLPLFPQETGAREHLCATFAHAADCDRVASRKGPPDKMPSRTLWRNEPNAVRGRNVSSLKRKGGRFAVPRASESHGNAARAQGRGVWTQRQNLCSAITRSAGRGLGVESRSVRIPLYSWTRARTGPRVRSGRKGRAEIRT
jgi:hypothetical protein